MKKLSATQQKVLEQCYKDIDLARSLSFEEWFFETQCHGRRDVYDYKVKRGFVEWAREYYENRKVGIVLTHCNSKTLEALKKAGCIEIIRDSKGEHYGIDRVKVLNY